MTEIEKGWLAGLIDGEGSIMLFRKKRYDVKHKEIVYITAQLSITNSHEKTLLKASALIEEITGKVPRWIDDIHGNCTNRKCMRICVDIYGHINKLLVFLNGCLVTKAEQAELALAFCNKAMVRKKLNQRDREMCWRKMKFLNQTIGKGFYKDRVAETKRETPTDTEGEAIVRTSQECGEQSRNVLTLDTNALSHI